MEMSYLDTLKVFLCGMRYGLRDPFLIVCTLEQDKSIPGFRRRRLWWVIHQPDMNMVLKVLSLQVGFEADVCGLMKRGRRWVSHDSIRFCNLYSTVVEYRGMLC